jgi:hypothetical protein
MKFGPTIASPTHLAPGRGSEGLAMGRKAAG